MKDTALQSALAVQNARHAATLTFWEGFTSLPDGMNPSSSVKWVGALAFLM